MTDQTTDFSALGLAEPILQNLVSLGYLQMTPVQKQGLPVILKGQDLIAQANTGSGKTAAFGLGILAHLNTASLKPQALVIVPTRELSEQVGQEIRRLARFSPNVKVVTLAGGSEERHKIKSLEQGAHIVVGTAGRLIKMLEKGVLNTDSVRTLVLDEADRLLELGSIGDVDKIASFIPLKRQTMLFSATFPNGIRKLSETLQDDPVQITIDSQHQTGTTEQLFVKCGDNKDEALLRVLATHQPESCIVFCNSRVSCQRVVRLLRSKRLSSLPLHSDLEQADRTLTLIRFDNRSCRILVATDLASRGLDIPNVSAVINYEMPRDHEQYVHRIGRTGRAGQAGLAVSLYTNPEREILRAISDYMKIDCRVIKVAQLDQFRAFDMPSSMTTLYITGGRKQNIRPGDILGALTKEAGLNGADVGKIHILDINSYVAIKSESVDTVLRHFKNGKIKGKKFKVGRA